MVKENERPTGYYHESWTLSAAQEHKVTCLHQTALKTGEVAFQKRLAISTTSFIGETKNYLRFTIPYLDSLDTYPLRCLGVVWLTDEMAGAMLGSL